MVFAICRYHLRDPEAAEDATQETFLSAHRSLLGGTEPRDPAAISVVSGKPARAVRGCRAASRDAKLSPCDA